MNRSRNLSRPHGWRLAGWAALGALLALPAIAMQLTAEVAWTASDFFFAAVLLGGLGIGVELAFRTTVRGWQRAGSLITMLAVFLILWANAAVGFVGDPAEPVNLVICAVAAAVVLVGLIRRFAPPAMTRGCLAAACVLPVTAWMGAPAGHPDLPEWRALLVFAALWLAAALCFARAGVAARSS